MVAAVVRQEAGITAVSTPFAKVVFIVQPLKLTSWPLPNPDPYKVSVNDVFNGSLVGEMELSDKLPEEPELETGTVKVPEVPVVGSRT